MADDRNNADRTLNLDLRRADRCTVDNAKVNPGTAYSLIAACAVPCGAPAFGAVSVYLLDAQGSGTVPAFLWELRALYGGENGELIAGASGGLSKLTTWGAEGSVVHVSGPRVLGYELWGAHDGSVPVPCKVRWILAPAMAGVPWHVENGGLV